LDAAVAGAVKAGIPFVVAAGNNGYDACNFSPGREPSAITVAASGVNDRIASFSSIGSCVDVIAPGLDTLSVGRDGIVSRSSGTSMSAGYVTGVLAVAMSAGIVTDPASAAAFIDYGSAANRIVGLDGSTKNLLAQVPQ
jgi:subtilisin family serine protease